MWGGVAELPFGWYTNARLIEVKHLIPCKSNYIGYQGLWLRVSDGETNVVVCCFYLFSSNESLTKTLGTSGFILSHAPSDMISLFIYSIFILSL